MAVRKKRGRKRKARRVVAGTATMTPRQWGIAATVTCAMLTPTLLTGTGTLDWINASNRSDIAAESPGPGDVLSAIRARGATDDQLGAGGRLPETDELSAAFLADADDLESLRGGLNPFDDLGEGVPGIPGVMLEAYQRAEERLAATKPGCNMSWSLLASIGRIESNHARGGRVDAKGNATPAILGPVLDGQGFAAIHDTDGGAFDGDSTWDRAVGPMQFIPGTWAAFAADGNGDGESNPNNIYDATVGAGNYLCSGGGDMDDPVQRAQAIFRYNHSDEYVATVMAWAIQYEEGVDSLPDLSGSDADYYYPPYDYDDYPDVPPTGDTGTGNPGSSSTSNPPQSSSSSSSTTTSRSTTTTTTPPTSGTTTTLIPSCPTFPTSTTTTTGGTTTSTTTSTTPTTTTTISVPPGCPTPPPPTTTTTTTTTTAEGSSPASGSSPAAGSSVAASSSMKPA
ncbi:lytic transglycosylase domain-containing protein [Umezawaea sp.]|uniref:lytic transglycosylase domain-containing protein n=1 Tax=Umezawaea sp. TaxID=1955258 RepID=UPI002ED07740